MSRTSLGLRLVRGCKGAAAAAADPNALLDSTTLRAACVLPLRGGLSACLHASPSSLEHAPRPPLSLQTRPFSGQSVQPAPNGTANGAAPAAGSGSGSGSGSLSSSAAAGQEQPPVRRNESGWDEADEPPPIPLDPNVKPPGMLFVTAGATLSAVLAVSVAALGIIGTFYAGWAISQVAKEMRKAEPSGAGGGGTGRTVQATAEGQAGPTTSAAAGGSADKQAVRTSPELAVTGSAGSLRPRSWWGWLGSFFRRRPRGAAGGPSGDDGMPPAAAPA